MSREQVQAALAYLYSSDRARSNLRRGRTRELSRFALSDRDVIGLRSLLVEQGEQVELFCSLLVKKRLDRIGAAFALSRARVSPAAYARVCERFLESASIEGTADDDATRFAHLLRAHCGDAQETEPILDLIALEEAKHDVVRAEPPDPQMRIAAEEAGSLHPILAASARICRLQNHPLVLERWARGELTARPIPDAYFTSVLVFRTFEDALEPAAAALKPWLAAVLRAADGRATIDELAGSIVADVDRSAAVAALGESILALSRSGAVALVENGVRSFAR